MGQYYTPVIVRDNKGEKTILKFYSWDYDNGLKLMEHSWFTNSFVETVAMQLFNNPGHIAWVGDYAEEYLHDLCVGGKQSLAEKYTEYVQIEKDERKSFYKHPKVDHRKNCLGLYFYNHTTKQYVDCYEFFVNNVYDDGGWKSCIHPLPLLTAIGNGYGGGDYYEGYPDYHKVGIWAGDEIELSTYNKKYLKELKYQNITDTLHWKEQN